MDAGITAALLVGLMCAVSIYGAVRIPAGARWPVRFGGLGFQTTLGRATGLILWPVLGGMVASLVWTGDDETIAMLTLFGLLLMLGAQLAAVRRLARG